VEQTTGKGMTYEGLEGKRGEGEEGNEKG